MLILKLSRSLLCMKNRHLLRELYEMYFVMLQLVVLVLPLIFKRLIIGTP